MNVLNPVGMDSGGLFNIASDNQFLTLTNSVFRQTADVTVANTTTTSSIVGPGVGSMTLPASSLFTGVAIRVVGSGVYSSATLLPGSLTIGLSAAGITFSTATLSGLLVGASNAGFNYSLMMVIRTIGTAGSMAVSGSFNYISSVSGARLTGDLNNSGAAATINTTIPNLIDITAKWQTATAANTLKSTICNMEILR